jgi:hypothetical protein
MKLNFWQWLGVVLLVIGGGWYIYDKYIKETPKPAPPAPVAPAPAPSAQPATTPATVPGTQPG